MTITEFINTEQNKDMQVKLFNYQQVLNENNFKGIVNLELITDRYAFNMSEYIRPLTLTEKEFDEYKFNPKKLSYTLYGNTCFWPLILFTNEWHSGTDFNTRFLKVFSKGAIANMIPQILSVDEELININIAQVKKDKTEANKSL